MKKKLLVVLGSIVVLFVVIILIGQWMMNGQDEVLALEFSEWDISAIEDGTYTGSYTGYRWKNTVEVTVENGEIASIVLINDVTFKREDITEQVFSEVLQKQSANIDILAGATVTTNAYLKAIENALFP